MHTTKMANWSIKPYNFTTALEKLLTKYQKYENRVNLWQQPKKTQLPT